MGSIGIDERSSNILINGKIIIGALCVVRVSEYSSHGCIKLAVLR